MLKFTKEENKTITQKAFDKSKATTSYKKTILAGPLDEAFKHFDEKFCFDYEPKQGDLGWHPSGDCLPPVSVLWAKAQVQLGALQGTSGKDMSHLTKIFMVGHYWHQIVQYLIVKEGWADASAIEGIGYRVWGDEGVHTYIVDDKHQDDAYGIIGHSARPFHYVRGQGDVAPLVMGNWTGLVDIKTMNPADFKAGLSQSRFANKYLAQINVYMDLFDLDQAIILAVDKGSSAFAEYTFVRDEKLVEQIYAKWRRVSDLLDTGTEPTEDDDKQYALYIGDQ